MDGPKDRSKTRARGSTTPTSSLRWTIEACELAVASGGEVGSLEMVSTSPRSALVCGRGQLECHESVGLDDWMLGGLDFLLMYFRDA